MVRCVAMTSGLVDGVVERMEGVWDVAGGLLVVAVVSVSVSGGQLFADL